MGISPGSGNAKYGAGVQTLIRPSDTPDPENPTTPGNATGVTWYTEQFTRSGVSALSGEQNGKTEAGHPIFKLTITWDGSTYKVDINGGAAPKEVIDFMNNKWGGEDSEAYIGFNAQNANKGGIVEVTVTKFGTNKSNATTPMGDDSEKPTNELKPKAPIADPATVPANAPAIYMTADRENTDTKNKPSASNGGFSTVNEDFSIHVIAERDTMTAAGYTVKNEVSYDIKDFPVAITLTRNFCSCGNEDGSCDALETAHYFIMAGDTLSATANFQTESLEMSYNSYDIGEDTYLYFYCDFSSEFEEPLEGRINGIRFDVASVDMNTEGANTFDVMFTAFFRTVEEAEAYVVNYVKELGWVKETEEPTTETPTEVTTETPVEDSTENPADATDTDDKQTTEAPKADDQTKESGCASAIGFSAIAAIVAVSSVGILTFRKKKQ